jgi:hypothetical protein
MPPLTASSVFRSAVPLLFPLRVTTLFGCKGREGSVEQTAPPQADSRRTQTLSAPFMVQFGL